LQVPLLKLTQQISLTDGEGDNLKYEKFKTYNKVNLSQCKLGDKRYTQISKVLFHHKSISYLKLLNISDNNLSFSCVSTIIELLSSCVIEKLIVTDDITNEINNCIFRSAYYGTSNILNFVKGVPLIVINRCYYDIINDNDHKDECLIQQDIMTVFVVNAALNDCTINAVTKMSEYNVYSYSIFLFADNMITYDPSYYVEFYNSLLLTVKRFTLFGANLRDDVALMISAQLKNIPKTAIQYFLISETKLLSNMSRSLPISRWLSTNPVTHISGCNIGEEIFSMFCRSLSTQPLFIKEVDLSSYQLTSKCIQTLVDSLEYCCIHRLKILNYGNKLNEITESIFDAHYAGKILRNHISEIPLIVIAYCSSHYNSELWANLFYFGFTNEIFDFYKYGQLQCFFFNTLKKCEEIMILQRKFFSAIAIDYCSRIFIYEVGLTDEVAAKLVNCCNVMPDKIEYILVSKTMLLAFRTEVMAILNALQENSLISTIKLESIKIYDGLSYIGLALSKKFQFLKNITFTKIFTGNEKYEDFSKSLLTVDL